MDVAQVPMQYSYSERAFPVGMSSSSGEVQSERRANARGHWKLELECQYRVVRTWAVRAEGRG